MRTYSLDLSQKSNVMLTSFKTNHKTQPTLCGHFYWFLCVRNIAAALWHGIRVVLVHLFVQLYVRATTRLGSGTSIAGSCWHCFPVACLIWDYSLCGSFVDAVSSPLSVSCVCVCVCVCVLFAHKHVGQTDLVLHFNKAPVPLHETTATQSFHVDRLWQITLTIGLNCTWVFL